MIKNTLAINRLQRDLGGSFHVVAKPDHPMLLNGPDLLIGGEGKLTAVIFVSKSESKKDICTRIMAIRLAMPCNTKILAVLPDDVSISSNILKNFDEITNTENPWREIARYGSSNNIPKTDRSALIENKRRHSEKYAFAMLLTKLRRKHEPALTDFNLVERELADIDSRSRIKFARDRISNESTLLTMNPIAKGIKGDYVGNPEKSNLRRSSKNINGAYVALLSSKRQPIRQLRNLCDSALMDSYALDNGVPYQLPDSNINILLINQDWPTVRHDPEKPARAAAFGCWIMARSTSTEDILTLIEWSRDPKHMRRWSGAQSSN